jgi:hypothetical protein
MSKAEMAKASDRKWPPLALCVIPLFIGLTGFYRVAQSPQFESYRTMHVVQLLVSGAGIGVALVCFFMWAMHRRT